MEFLLLCVALAIAHLERLGVNHAQFLSHFCICLLIDRRCFERRRILSM